nr:uncharacterized mitochondrial protein AtMg00810-like [Tanacetum cinerariifolium]
MKTRLTNAKIKRSKDNFNNNNNVNAASTNGVNTVGENTNNELSFDHEMPALKDIITFNFTNDHEDDDEEADMNNMDTTIQVSPTPTTRIHKNHPLDQVIGDLHSTTQTRHMLKNLEEHRSQECKHTNGNSKPLLKDEDGEKVDVHIYRSMIGSLMYLTSLRPDIMFAVCACARYQVNLKVSHLHVVKRIFRYLKGHPKLVLWYQKDSSFDLVAYTDSDYARASLDRKSTTEGVNTPQSDEDILKLKELMKLCTNLQSRVLALEKIKATQANEIDSLKIESSNDNEDLGEDASKQWRINDIDADEGITLVSTHNVAELFDVDQDLYEEQQELNDKEKATLFMKLLEKRGSSLQQREMKKKGTDHQQELNKRSIMCTYLKNIEGWKPKSLKNKFFDNIQELFDKAMKRVNTFVDYRTELVVESSKKAETEVTEGSSKRAGEEIE